MKTRQTPEQQAARMKAVMVARAVLAVFENAHPGDDRPRRATEVASRYALGQATAAELARAETGADEAAAHAACGAWELAAVYAAIATCDRNADIALYRATDQAWHVPAQILQEAAAEQQARAR